MKKTLIATALMIALLFACLAGPATAETAEQERAAETRMLNDLINYTFQCEILYGDVLWVLDAFDAFDADRSWDSLQKARAALIIAEEDIRRCALPEQDMTAEDQRTLMRKGIDVSFMENLSASFAGEKTTVLNTCGNLRDGIMLGVFLRGDWQACMREAAALRELMGCNIQYLAFTTDWVLSSLHDDATAQSFRDMMESYCPLTYACQSQTLESPEAYEAAADELLSRMDALLMEESKALGAHQDRLNALTEQIDAGDFAAIGADLLDIADLPLALFYPTWYRDDDVLYYWEQDGAVTSSPAPGAAIERAPDGCRIRISGVSREEAEAYRLEAEQAGLPCLGTTETDESLTVFYEYDGSSFALLWEEDSVTFLMMEKPFCFVPRWYHPALQAIQGDAS